MTPSLTLRTLVATAIHAPNARAAPSFALPSVCRYYSQAKPSTRKSTAPLREATRHRKNATNTAVGAGISSDGTILAQGGNTQGDPPLYEVKPPWYIKWMWVLVGTTVIWTGTASELVWNEWTQRVVTANPDDPSREKIDYVPRPIYQRAALCGFIIFGGVACAAGLFLVRARTVTRLVLRGNDVTISTWGDWRGRGRVVEKQLCTIQGGNSARAEEMTLNVVGVRGRYRVSLKGASVNGRPGGVWDVRRGLQGHWHGVALRGKWVEGASEGEWS
ncbi:hypothetical protein BOTBODRAFT_55694 [Botryobasidium botryosum FD-172 SS1]|uniref:Uncharacterized protein n=1 Tax=Botryobasidium botryosum (strain FD-172 SS1) TaxID=930990 RepID=A0A067MQ01_BOTB1|nr:hypothetical protein BOTBODRAFT_55694 [Botryobasidium botryosum FD-172 SS1]